MLKEEALVHPFIDSCAKILVTEQCGSEECRCRANKPSCCLVFSCQRILNIFNLHLKSYFMTTSYEKAYKNHTVVRVQYEQILRSNMIHVV